MHSKSDNTETMINDKVDEIIENRFESLLNRYQIELENSKRGCDFLLGCVHLLYYKCHKMNFKRGGSCKDFPDWINKKKETINPIKK